MKQFSTLLITAVLAGGVVASTARAVAPANKRTKPPTEKPTGSNVRGRGDRDAQARLQAAPLEMRVTARKLQLDILNADPAFPALQARIATARTDEIKRGFWNQYYVRLYGEMRRRNPGLKEYIDLLETVARSRYESAHKRGEALDSAGFDRSES
jgi:hypothetical protein